MVDLQQPSSQNREIEALRCFAVTIVVMGHSHNLLAWHDGTADTAIGFWTGVDAFLGISGFVITKYFRQALLTAFANGVWLQDSADFLVRRAFRLLPNALFWLSVGYLASIFFNRSGAFGSPAQNLRDAVAIVLSVSNIYFAMCATGSLAGCGPNGIYWTASLEQQFYILFPALILLRKKHLIGLCCVIVLFFAVVHRDAWVWYNRVDTIAVGILIALLSETAVYETLEPKWLGKPGLRWIAAVSLLGFLLFGVDALTWAGLFAVTPACVTVTVGVLIFLISFNKGYLFPTGRMTSVLATLGLRSYSVYLTHNLAMAATTETFSRFTTPNASWDVPVILTAVIYLLIFSEFSYRMIEVPSRAYGRKFKAGKIAVRPTHLTT